MANLKMLGPIIVFMNFVRYGKRYIDHTFTTRKKFLDGP